MADRDSPRPVIWLPSVVLMMLPRNGSVDSSVSLHPWLYPLEVPEQGMGHLVGWREHYQSNSSSSRLLYVAVCCEIGGQQKLFVKDLNGPVGSDLRNVQVGTPLRQLMQLVRHFQHWAAPFIGLVNGLKRHSPV
ncbi:uncharacterized protein FMAN_01886 [Fusarium mangiferae]|uniref:Uncharacterized protein n=1 Tax=Fusarium mangiferae TaxID=192010 RepID=A0A1L7SKM4_FUSMA|nr:uncharacterized protein FMAN_01886 [Fusarium mangiferae]CVK84963.1 uncharacterized protein FMAN_01886 [Fusarium mangiferae]